MKVERWLKRILGEKPDEKFIRSNKKKKNKRVFQPFPTINNAIIIFDDSSKCVTNYVLTVTMGDSQLVKIKLFNFVACSLYSIEDNCFGIHARVSRINWRVNLDTRSQVVLGSRNIVDWSSMELGARNRISLPRTWCTRLELSRSDSKPIYE